MFLRVEASADESITEQSEAAKARFKASFLEALCDKYARCQYLGLGIGQGPRISRGLPNLLFRASIAKQVLTAMMGTDKSECTSTVRRCTHGWKVRFRHDGRVRLKHHFDSRRTTRILYIMAHSRLFCSIVFCTHRPAYYVQAVLAKQIAEEARAHDWVLQLQVAYGEIPTLVCLCVFMVGRGYIRVN